MKHGLKEYSNELKKLSEENISISDKELKYHYIKIKNYQHERLIHLLITITFSFITLFSLYFAKTNIAYLVVTLISFIMLVCYIPSFVVKKLKKVYFLLKIGFSF